MHFRIHGAGKKNLHGDGLALWYTQERLVPGRWQPGTTTRSWAASKEAWPVG